LFITPYTSKQNAGIRVYRRDSLSYKTLANLGEKLQVMGVVDATGILESMSKKPQSAICCTHVIRLSRRRGNKVKMGRMLFFSQLAYYTLDE
jgi:hypothetical protein